MAFVTPATALGKPFDPFQHWTEASAMTAQVELSPNRAAFGSEDREATAPGSADVVIPQQRTVPLLSNAQDVVLRCARTPRALAIPLTATGVAQMSGEPPIPRACQ